MTEDERNTIDAVIAVFEKHLKKPGFLLENPHVVLKYLRAKLQTEIRELFFVLFLNAQNRLIEGLPMSVGGVTSVNFYTRHIVGKAIDLDAISVIVAHNHPSGNPTPSLADKNLTKKLYRALELIDLLLIDHIIIAGACHSFFRERRLLSGLPLCRTD